MVEATKKDPKTKEDVSFYKFDIGLLPDELYRPEVPVSRWLSRTQTAGPQGFPPGSLNVLHPIPWDVEFERVIGIALYMAWNVIPFALPLLGVISWLVLPILRSVFYFVIAYVVVLQAIETFVFAPYFLKKYSLQTNEQKSNNNNRNAALVTECIRSNQFLFTERNITKYLSTTFVWPAKVQRPHLEHTPVIFCVVPHGVAPIGITAYPLWSRLWNDRLCRWTGAPILMKIPFVSFFLKKVGYIPASQQPILEALTKKEENVGIILDGIDGMFHPPNEENASILHRKGIVKIALKAGVPIIPVYGFGHTTLWTVLVDPFGILERLSHHFQASITPFFGRWGWFLGPPRRIPVVVCLGEPIVCPRTAEPTPEQVNQYHQQLLSSFHAVFETHKSAYGWSQKQLKFL